MIEWDGGGADGGVARPLLNQLLLFGGGAGMEGGTIGGRTLEGGAAGPHLNQLLLLGARAGREGGTFGQTREKKG